MNDASDELPMSEISRRLDRALKRSFEMKPQPHNAKRRAAGSVKSRWKKSAKRATPRKRAPSA
jgi:hypothetical protein